MTIFAESGASDLFIGQWSDVGEESGGVDMSES